jgi:cytochrome c
MPYGNAGTLSDDEVYAIVAYILYSNDLIEDDFVLSNETFFDVEMPNADGFIVDDRAETEYARWTGAPCMENCKESAVKVTMRAMVLDVTPEQESADTEATPAAAEIEAEPVVAAATVDPELIKAGEKVFRKCKACHQIGEGAKNRSGPILTGVVGNAAGSVEGFKYSKALAAMAADGLVWDEEALRAFLAAPKAFMKGTKMSFAGLKDDGDLEAITAYLASFAK